MSVFGNNTTNFQITGTDIGNQVPLNNAIQRDYLIDVYPSLIGTFKQAGLWVWGRNAYGQLGDNTTTFRSSPVQTVSSGTNWKQVFCADGPGSSCGIKTDGTLWTWGHNAYGQLGDNSTTNRSSPVQTVAGGSNWKQVAAGLFSMAAIKTDGTLWLWGHNNQGQLGDNTNNNHRSSPVQTISGGTNWKQVTCGEWITGAIKTDGTLWTWGMNGRGGLGDNTTVWKSSPVQTVSGGTNWKQVSTINSGRMAAIKTDGTLWTWGDNEFGQLGDNSTAHRSSPVQTVSTGTNWKQVSGGRFAAGAIKTDGTLWTWGSNNFGQLGDNSTTNRSSPVQTVSTGTNWKQVSASGNIVGGIKTDGTLWLWGGATSGGLGNNGNLSQSSPVQTVSGGTNWKQLSTAGSFSIAIRDDSADIFGYPT